MSNGGGKLSKFVKWRFLHTGTFKMSTKTSFGHMGCH